MKPIPSPFPTSSTKTARVPEAGRVGHRPVPRALRILQDKAQRSCGSCQECCIVGQVPELAKPAGVRCDHLRRDRPGCNTYETRPPSCASFKCLWVQGVGPDAYRPDRTGIYLVLQEIPEMMTPHEAAPGVFARDNLAGQKRAVIAFECHREAARTTGRSMLDELRRSIPIGLVPFPENPFPRQAPPATEVP